MYVSYYHLLYYNMILRTASTGPLGRIAHVSGREARHLVDNKKQKAASRGKPSMSRRRSCLLTRARPVLHYEAYRGEPDGSSDYTDTSIFSTPDTNSRTRGADNMTERQRQSSTLEAVSPCGEFSQPRTAPRPPAIQERSRAYSEPRRSGQKRDPYTSRPSHSRPATPRTHGPPPPPPNSPLPPLPMDFNVSNRLKSLEQSVAQLKLLVAASYTQAKTGAPEHNDENAYLF